MGNIEFSASQFNYVQGSGVLNAPVIVSGFSNFRWAYNYKLLPNTGNSINITKKGIYEFSVNSLPDGTGNTYTGGIEITDPTLADSTYIAIESHGKPDTSLAGETFFFGILNGIPFANSFLNIEQIITAVAHGGIPCYEYKIYVNGILRSLTDQLSTKNLQLNDRVTVIATDCCCTQIVAQSFVVPVGLANISALLLTKTFNATDGTPLTSIEFGTVFNLIFTITNPNPLSAIGVAFTDNFPSGFSVAGSVISSNLTDVVMTANIGGNAFILSNATLAANTTATITVPIITNSSAITNQPVTNITSIITAFGLPDGAAAQASITIGQREIPVAPLYIAKQFNPNPIELDGISTLTFYVFNPNPVNTNSDVAFSDTFPTSGSGSIVVAAPPVSSTSNFGAAAFIPLSGSGIVSLSGGTIPANSFATAQVNVTNAPGSAVGVYQNTSSIVTGTIVIGIPFSIPSLAGGSDNLTLTIFPPQISIEFAPNQIPVGDVANLIFTIVNINTSHTLTNIAFTDVYDSTQVSPSAPLSTCGGGTVSVSPSPITFSNGTMAPGFCSFTVPITGLKAGTWNNTTSIITSDQGNGNSASGTLTIQ